MKKLFSFFLVLALTLSASAIPAKRGTLQVKNSDGTQMEISLRGDETFHFYVRTSDGMPVRRNADGDWVADTRDVTSLWRSASRRRNAHRATIASKVHSSLKAAPLKASEDAGLTGSKRALLILVNFSDVKFSNSSEQTKAIFTQMVNGLENPYGRNHGSVREFFRDQSYGKFDIEFDVVGPVTLPQPMKYYGQNVDANGNPTTGDGDDANAIEMVTQAVALVDPEVNFADYDWDGDGEVENIYITYAGYSEAYSGADPNTIWPHQWCISEGTSEYDYWGNVTKQGAPITVDGVKVDTYACGSELMGLSGTVIEGIGTMCHEYSHCLGLPDFYDVYYSGYVDMFDWSVMAQGCNNDSGFTPCGYTAYERWFSGWLEPIELNAPCNINELAPIEDSPVAYVIYNDNHRDEYYMLANHQKKGWDSKQEGHGMMILHVDYDETSWYYNEVNTTQNHPRMAIIPADNELNKIAGYYYADEGDLWPGSKNNTALTATSRPAATLYNKNTDGTKFMRKDIEDIQEENGLISFSFMGGAARIDTPVAADATDVDAQGFTANWSAVEGAVSYDLTLTETYDDGEEDPAAQVLQALVLIEDCEKLFVENDEATTDNSTDIGPYLDDYTYMTGWTGDKVYQGLWGAKLGTSTKKGYMVSPVMESTSGNASVYLIALDWFNYSNYISNGIYKADESTLDVMLMDADGNVLQTQNITATDILEASSGESQYDQLLTFENVPAEFRICFATTAGKKRVYLNYLLVFDGNFSLDEIYSIFDSEDDDTEDYAFDGVKARRPSRTILADTLKRAAELRRKPVSSTQTFSNITSTSMTFYALKAGATYVYSVRAVDAEGNKSGWSDGISVTLPTEEVAITSTYTTPTASATFDLSGRRLHNGQKACGIYIRNGKKVFIK